VEREEYLSRRQVAQETGLSLVTIDRYIKSGELPVVQIGRRILIKRSSLDDWLSSRERRRGHTPPE
jgi:excisionase family DNA binding protein